VVDALLERNVDHAYASRKAAGSDIFKALTDPEVTEILIMGISLNDFTQGLVKPDAQLRRAWETLEEWITHPDRRPGQRKLDIRVLIIDPKSFGAQLRAFGETPRNMKPERLRRDVEDTAETLQKLKAIVNQQANPLVTFDFRFYRLPPQLFVCRTDKSSFVQPYYFWETRHDEVPVPLLRYSDSAALHTGTRNHFEIIWEHASVIASDYLEGKETGFDRGVHETGITNIYTDLDVARERMEWVVREASNRLYIMGISLNTFFKPGGSLLATIQRAIEKNPQLDVKVLLLNPDSDAAASTSSGPASTPA
jgi:hypothetical protein